MDYAQSIICEREKPLVDKQIITQRLTTPKLTSSVRNDSLATQTYDILHRDIISGQIKPGQRIGQTAIAKQLGVSERTVREAFSRLAGVGLAEYEPYKGISVVALSVDDIVEAYRMRSLIEGEALELCVRHITPQEIQQMKDLVSNMSDNVENAVLSEQANREFHWTYIRASHSKVVEKVLENLWEMMFGYNIIRQQWNSSIVAATDQEQHIAILEALIKKNGKLAAKYNRMHMGTTIQLIKDYFDSELETTEEP